MSRRIDIELTSTRDDGTWTWRAAGAKQPKGSLDGSLLSADASVGDTLRAEVETTLDGTDVLSVSAPKAKNRREDETIELIGRELRDDELVVETRARRGRRDRGERGDRGDRGDRRGRRDGGRGDRGDGPRGDRGDRRDRPRRSDDDRGRGEGRGDGRGRSRGDRPDRPRRERAPLPPKPKRLRPGRVHRKAALAELPPEEKVIAEQVLQGGLPAVRQAVDKMNEQYKAEGKSTIKADPLLAVAEKLLPALRAAEWHDRADAAVADLEELDLRDLRSVVAAADQAGRDEESRELVNALRDGLTRRVDEEQAKWLAEITTNLDEGRVVRALRLSSRPPKPAPLPADLATRLTEAASASLTADTLVDRWATVLDALQFAPVRLNVVPASKPAEPGEELIAAITRVASRVPKIAEAFGIEAPSEEPRRRGRGRKPTKGRKADGGAAPSADAATAPPADSAVAPAAAPPEAPAEPATAEPATTEQAASEQPTIEADVPGTAETPDATDGSVSDADGTAASPEEATGGAASDADVAPGETAEADAGDAPSPEGD